MSLSEVAIAGLFCHPVKALGAAPLATADITPAGLVDDRRWMVVDTRIRPARAVTQRELATLAAIRVERADAAWRLIAPDGTASTLRTLQGGQDARRYRVRLWSREWDAIDAGDATAEWLAHATGMRGTELRIVECAPAGATEANRLSSFVDDAALLITSAPSLAALNAALYGGRGGRLPMDRFRPNIVLSGLVPWEEDHLAEIRIGTVRLRLTAPCVRCEVTATDQTSGQRSGEEPLITLSRLRSDPDRGGATFGWYAIPETPGRLALGQPAEVIHRF